MAASSDLFELIKSLTKSEKRYFRMSGSFYARNRGNRYLHLFDMIDRQEEYNEKALRAEFTSRFGAAYLPEAKYYLYNAILKALHAYEADQDVVVRLATMLHQAKILLRKKLFRQCSKLLRRLREEAASHEQWGVGVDALILEFQLFMEQEVGSREGCDRIIDDVNRHVALWNETIERWPVYARLLHLRNAMGAPRSPGQLAMYEDAARDGCLHDGSASSSVTAALYKGFSEALHLEARRDYRGALDRYRSLLTLAESSSYWSRTDNVAVVPILNCICLMSVLGGDVATFFHYHPILLRRTAASPGSLHYRLHLRALAFGAELLVGMGEFDRALGEARKLEQCRDADEGLPDPALDAQINFILHDIHFGLGNHAQCVEHLNALLDLKEKGLRRSQYTDVRVRQLILHFELGNMGLVESLLRSTHRYLIANSLDYTFEHAFLSFVRKALRTTSGSDLDQLFRSLRDEVEALLDDPFEMGFNGLENIICWLESRIGRRPYGEVVRERYRREEIHAGMDDAGGAFIRDEVS